MGCDIHASVEWRRREASGERSEWWVSVLDCGFLPRDYVMFSAMVDGHGRDYDSIGGVAPERGWPPEPSEIGGEARWAKDHPDNAFNESGGVHGGEHTFSWLTAAEFRAAIQRCEEKRPGDPVDPEYKALSAYMDSLEAHGPVRLVFGFDS